MALARAAFLGARRVAGAGVAAPLAASRRGMAISAKVVRYERHGAPSAVLSVATESLSEDIGASQVLVRFLAAPISPSDLAQVRMQQRQS